VGFRECAELDSAPPLMGQDLRGRGRDKRADRENWHAYIECRVGPHTHYRSAASHAKEPEPLSPRPYAARTSGTGGEL